MMHSLSDAELVVGAGGRSTRIQAAAKYILTEIYLDGGNPYRKISAVKCTYEATDIGPEGVE